MIWQIEINGAIQGLELQAGTADGVYLVKTTTGEVEVNAHVLRPGVLSLLIGGKAYRCVLTQRNDGPLISVDGRQYSYRVEDPRSLKSRRRRADEAEGARPVKASMPGRVIRVLVGAGEAVEAQQALLVIEAMKMQNEVKAPKAGRLRELRVQAGEAVSSGQVLAVIE